jgi:DNA-binding LacI/PurR family transcriptional regulator
MSTPLVTMADLARLAGVSQSTVSRALAGHPLISATTRTKIEELARSTGFVVNPAASALRSRRSNVVCVLITLIHDRDQHVSDPFMMTMLAHLADALTDAGYDMLLSKVSTHEDGWIERIFSTRRPAAAILIGQSLEHASIERAAQAGCRLVVWGARLRGQSYATVGTDNRSGGHLAASHLIARGYRRLAFLGDTRLPEIAQRHAGFTRAHKEAGLAPDRALTVCSSFDPAEALKAANSLIDTGHPFDSVVAASDVIAFSAMKALSQRGLHVPTNVAVVGFDDIEMAAYTNPALTTVRQDLPRAAKLLVQTMCALIEDRAVAPVELPAQLVVRDTTPDRSARVRT